MLLLLFPLNTSGADPGVPSRELCDEDETITVRASAPRDGHPSLAAALHQASASPGSAFTSSLGPSGVAAQQMDCRTYGKNRVFGLGGFFGGGAVGMMFKCLKTWVSSV